MIYKKFFISIKKNKDTRDYFVTIRGIGTNFTGKANHMFSAPTKFDAERIAKDKIDSLLNSAYFVEAAKKYLIKSRAKMNKWVMPKSEPETTQHSITVLQPFDKKLSSLDNEKIATQIIRSRIPKRFVFVKIIGQKQIRKDGRGRLINYNILLKKRERS